MRTISLISLLTTLFCFAAKAQDTIPTNFYSQIKNYDLSVLLAEDAGNSPSFPLGFIGNNFQRFKIHFITIKKNEIDPYEYKVFGKTMLKNDIITFQGSIIIKEAQTYKFEFYNDSLNKREKYIDGWVSCDIYFYQDPNVQHNSSGFIKGKLISYFYFDKAGRFLRAELSYSDGFNNNQFIGKWTSYDSHEQEKCNWGDYRIPESKSLDIGAGDFSPDPKYLKYGWANFSKANFGDQNDPETKKAKAIESKQWWK